MNVKIENNSVNLCDSCEKDCETCDAYDKDYLPGDCDTNICCCSKYAPLMTREQLNDGPDNNETTDLISRKAAIEAVGKLRDGCDNGGWCGECRIDYPDKDAIDVLEALPTAEPKRGYWKYNAKIGTFKVWTCDQCGWNSEAEFNYCPNCGAKMEGERDG